MPGEVEGLQVVGAQLVTDIGQHRFGTEGRGKAVGHIARDAEGVCGGEGALRNAKDVELQRCRMTGLVLVDAIQVGGQGLARRAVGVHLRRVGIGVSADA